MLNINVSLVEISRTRNFRNYKLVYNGEVYILTVNFGEKIHNKLWECEKGVPEDIAPFVTRVLAKEVSEFRARIGEIMDVFEDWIIESKNKKKIPEDFTLDKEDLVEMEKHIADMIYNYK